MVNWHKIKQNKLSVQSTFIQTYTMSDLIKNSERNMGVHYQRYITKWLPWGVDYN